MTEETVTITVENYNRLKEFERAFTVDKNVKQFSPELRMGGCYLFKEGYNVLSISDNEVIEMLKKEVKELSDQNESLRGDITLLKMHRKKKKYWWRKIFR